MRHLVVGTPAPAAPKLLTFVTATPTREEDLPPRRESAKEREWREAEEAHESGDSSKLIALVKAQHRLTERIRKWDAELARQASAPPSPQLRLQRTGPRARSRRVRSRSSRGSPGREPAEPADLDAAPPRGGAA